MALSLGLSAAASAQQPIANDALKRQLESRMKGLKITGLAKTNFNNLIEVSTDEGDVFYTDEKGSFLIIGVVRDGADPNRNLTEERIQKLTAVKWSDLPLKQAFPMVRGKGQRQIAYFSDPNCPYCRQFERELMQLENVTVHVFLYPILAADSAPKSRNVLCAPDKAKAWTELMLNGVQPPVAPAQCNAPIDQILAFGKKLRVQSVPTVVLSNGVRIAGVRTAAQLSKLIDDAGKS